MLNLMVLSHDVVHDVNDLPRTLVLPKRGVQLASNKESKLIQEASYQLSFVSSSSHYSQKLAAHILACLAPFAKLIFVIVLDLLIIDGLLELIDAVKVSNGVLLLVVLLANSHTLLERRGRPRVLSVLGLISCPGALMNIALPSPHASA